MKTYRHPDTKETRVVGDNAVQIAALKKLGYVEITAKDIENEARLSVTYEQVSRADVPVEPPALPKLTTPVPVAPPSAPRAITREDVDPLTKSDKK